MGRDKGLEESSSRDEKGHSVPFYKLFAFADSTDKMLMIGGLIGGIGNGACLPVLSLLFGDLIDAFGQTRTNDIVSAVSKLALKLVYLALGSAAASFLQMACWITTGERQSARTRILYLSTILRQDIEFFDTETSTGEVVGRMSGDTLLIQDAMGEKVGKFLQYLSSLVGGVVIAYTRGWLLALITTSSLPLTILCGFCTNFVLSKMTSRGQEAYAKAAALVEQTIGSIRTVASFGGEKEAVAEYDRSLVKAVESGVQEGWASGLGVGAITFVIFATYALTTWCGAKFIMHKGYTGGDVIGVLFAVIIGATNLGQIPPCLSAFASGQAAAFKMFQTIKRKPVIDAYDNGGRILDDIVGEIELRDVHFSYPARPNEPIFRGFCLSISSGTTMALVGQSGSGKSTVISLIERFYDPQSGEVTIDGVNLKHLQLKWIRSKIGLVSQEPVLFTGSIKDNIAYGKDGATTEEIRVATELANAAKFIDKLPQGLDTLVGEHGTQLSGGQKQRIAIARAILKDPRILLLDEATSALDSESEGIVQEALDRIMVSRTTVIVAHRLTTVRNANTIAVINQGKVVEKGTHFELLQDPDGAYTQLLHLQQVNRDFSEHVNDKEVSDSITVDVSERQSSLKMSFLHSLSRGSSGMGNSVHHQSLPFTIGLPVPVHVPDQPNPDASSSKKPPNVSILRLANLNKKEAGVLMVGTVSAIIIGVIMPLFGILISQIIKAFYEPPHKLRKDTKFWAIIFVLIGLIYFLVSPIKSYMFGVVGNKLIRRIRLMCFEKVVNMEVGWFDEPDHLSGVIGARLSTNASMFRNVVGDGLAQMVENLSTIVAALIISFQASWLLSLIGIAVLPLVALSGYVQLRSVMGFSNDAKAMYEEASQVANDAVGSIRTVASYCAQDKVVAIYRKKCEGPVTSGIKQGVVSGISFAFSNAILYLNYALAYYAGARLVRDGKISFSNVFRVFFTVIIAGNAISQFSVFVADFAKAKSAAASIFAILDRKSKIDPRDESGIKLENVNGKIELRHVSFKYPTRPDVQILRDLSLAIHCGKSVALVGESGSGKSTVISLLQRFYDPDSGQITLDGTEIHKFQLKWLRQQMGLVSQEPVLFNDTIRANIAYGKEGNASEAEIIAAAKLVNAHTYISGLNQGYETMVGERGVQLSGGQKQRVAIARAILKNPKILLLDEATSALDAESERIVQEALDQAMLNRTTVIVAHRLSTIASANTIAVMKNGVIVEKGSHETLINIKDGFYASLVALSTTTPP